MKKEYLDLLNDFINASALAQHIDVEVREGHTSYKPKYDNSAAHYEDCNLLSSILQGAEHFCYYLERNNYTIIKGGAKSNVLKKPSRSKGQALKNH